VSLGQFSCAASLTIEMAVVITARLLWIPAKKSVDAPKKYSVRQEKTVSPKSISSLSYAFLLFTTVGTGLRVLLWLPCREMETG
jgi:hypothetical protein